MNLVKKRLIPVLVGLVVTALFGWLLLAGVDLRAVGAAAAGARWDLLGLVVAIRALSFLFAAARSTVVFAPIADISLRTQLESLAIGFVGNTVLPLRIGLLLRVGHLSRESDTAPETVLGAITAERLMDIGILLTLALAMLPTLSARGATPAAVVTVATVLGVLLVALVVIAPRAEAAAAPLPEPLARRMVGLFQGIRTLGNGRRLTRTLAWSLGFWACQASSVLLALTAFGLPAPPWAAGAFLVLVAFGGAIPSGPAFSGPWHYFAALTAGLVGADEAVAAAFALVAHFVTFVPLALLALGWVGGRFAGALRTATPAEAR